MPEQRSMSERMKYAIKTLANNTRDIRPVPMVDLYQSVQRIAAQLGEEAPGYAAVLDIVQEEHQAWEAAKRRVRERLAPLEDRAFHNYVAQVIKDQDEWREGFYNNLSQQGGAVPSSGTGSTCRKCKGTGQVQCHICEGKGSYPSRWGGYVTCEKSLKCKACDGRGKLRE